MRITKLTPDALVLRNVHTGGYLRHARVHGKTLIDETSGAPEVAYP
jgi:hypothetical protein